MYVYHGGKFIGDSQYVGGKRNKLHDIEWAFTTQDLDSLGNAVGYDKVVKSGVRMNGDKLFTFLPEWIHENIENQQLASDIIGKAIDVNQRCVNLYIEALVYHKGKGQVSESGNACMVDVQEDKSDNSCSEENIEEFDSESDYVLSDYSDDDEEVIEARKKLREHKMQKKMEKITAQENIIDFVDSGSDTSLDSYDLETGSDDEEILVKKKRDKHIFYATNTNLQDMDWELGMKFKDKKECQDAISSWAIVNGWNLRWTKSSEMRVQAECVAGCNWRLYASQLSHEPTFVIKRYDPYHDCIKVKRNRQANRKWISKQLVGILKLNPNMQAKTLEKLIEERHDVIINRQMCYRARKLAMEKIRGSYKDDYKKLRSYVLELMKTDAEGTFLLKTNLGKKGPVFHRMFIGFSALMKGFLHGCRHIISFDACFLKTHLKGVLLAAVGKDCNMKMYPISWAVVEQENDETWTWFLEIFLEQFGIQDGLGWTFMSDKQKGLTKAVRKLAPNAEHRHCARHVYANFKKKWGGPKYRDLFWECVKASTPAQFENCLANLKSESVEAWEDFCLQNPAGFCKSLISSVTKTAQLDNNICETFNSFILHARDKPILQMLEDIRMNLMTRQHDIAEALHKGKDEICPNVRKWIYKIEKWTKFCDIKPSPVNKYEVHYFGHAFIVDLVGKSCSCREWDLTGIPCCHALACIHYVRDNVSGFVDRFFLKSNAVELYTHGMSPIHGEQDWPKDHLPSILPPEIRKQPGRPRKHRRRSADEFIKHNSHKLTRHEIKMSCKNCGGVGHNKRTCKELPKRVDPPNEGDSSAAPLDGATLKKKSVLRSTSSTKGGSSTATLDRATLKKNSVFKSNPSNKGGSSTATLDRATLKKNYALKNNPSDKANQGFGVLHTDMGNVFIRPPGESTSHFVHGPARNARVQTKIDGKIDANVHGSQVVNPTPP